VTPGDDAESLGTAEDADLGQPVTELRDVTLGVGDQFATRVRGRIERRVLTGEFLELLWTAPLTMLLEFLRWPFELFRRGRT
jgi:hypothetical protein